MSPFLRHVTYRTYRTLTEQLELFGFFDGTPDDRTNLAPFINRRFIVSNLPRLTVAVKKRNPTYSRSTFPILFDGAVSCYLRARRIPYAHSFPFRTLLFPTPFIPFPFQLPCFSCHIISLLTSGFWDLSSQVVWACRRPGLRMTA